MKILLVNYHYPPSNTAHSYRWKQLTDDFVEKGHKVHVVCGGDIPSEQKANVTVDCVNSTLYKLISRGNKVNKNQKINDIKINKNQKSKVSVKQNFTNICKSVYRYFFWPDGLWHWLPSALYSVFKVRNEKFDLVIGYSPTFSSVIAAYYYKKLNPNTNLIIDFGDPFSTSVAMPVNNYTLYNKLNKCIESRVFNAARLVSFTNEQTLELYKVKYSQIKHFVVYPHLVDVDKFYSEKIVNAKNRQIYIGYIGGFHKGIREPTVALNVMKRVLDSNTNITIDFYGPLNGVGFNGNENINHRGQLSRDAALNKMKEFDILIHVENEECPMTPSKVVEYIATGKPIINILSETKKSSFDNYPLVINADNSSQNTYIENFILLNYKHTVDRKVIENILKNSSLESVALKYLSGLS